MSRPSAATALLALALAAPPTFAQKKAVAAPTPVPAAVGPGGEKAPAQAPAADAARSAERKLDAWKTAEARADLEPVAGQAAASADVAVALGRLLEQERKYDESASVLRKAAAAAPSDPRLPLRLGEALLRAKKGSEADAEFRRAVDLATRAASERPADAGAFLLKGMSLQRLRRYDEAMEALGRARELDGGSAATLLEMGATRAFQQRWAEAVDLLGQSLAKEPGTAFGYYYRGLAQEKLGRKDLMVLDLDRFVKLAPAAPEADRARAILAAARR